MRTAITFILIVVLFACNTKSAKSDNPFTKEEQEQYINTLSLYLQVDSVLVAERNQTFQLLRMYMDEGEDTDSIYYMKNIAHVDSVIHTAIGLVEQSNTDDLLALLEQERHNIYAHPCNSIDNELALHKMLVQLYNKAYKEYTDEYYSKIIDLVEFDRIHILGLLGNEQYIPYYIGNMMALIDLYYCANRYSEAIQTGKELCGFTKDIDNSMYIWSVLLLGSVYEDAGLTEQQDSCINSIKHLPEFKEIYDEFYRVN